MFHDNLSNQIVSLNRIFFNRLLTSLLLTLTLTKVDIFYWTNLGSFFAQVLILGLVCSSKAPKSFKLVPFGLPKHEIHQPIYTCFITKSFFIDLLQAINVSSLWPLCSCHCSHSQAFVAFFQCCHPNLHISSTLCLIHIQSIWSFDVIFKVSFNAYSRDLHKLLFQSKGFIKLLP